MTVNETHRKYLFFILLVLVGGFCLTPWMPPFLALAAGALVAISLGNPVAAKTGKVQRWMLAISVVGLGAGMNLNTVATVGLQGIGYTLAGIAFVLALGFALFKLLKADWQTATLIACGTAICGGSAIAAITPVIDAKPQSTSVALGTVFLLNALALLIFPFIGHAFSMTEAQFGLWSALAIHDTSSVVGAGLQYGPEALRIGTTVKLARALWIVPLALGISYMPLPTAEGDAPRWRKSPKKPWFILGFIGMAALVTYIPALKAPGAYVETAARHCLVLTLFLIGCGLTLETLKAVGIRPLVMGVVLWVAAACVSLAAILSGFVHI